MVQGWAGIFTQQKKADGSAANAFTSRLNSRPLPRDGATSARSEFNYLF
ncbi:hypothetical protein KUF71_000096 [Frankliniella fusca]|uniref:Uncharacterized protein n=1 Tax=Frankliniella fusca TaxID=407009 RepID=A0AAE1L4N1_9NEOP|nr:hypothetical protein KUF71_000096 [Frankliniella fusca]